MNYRILKHVLFWLVYTFIYAYLSASFPAKSDLAYNFSMRLFRFWMTECIQLPVKLLAIYGLLYWLFPTFLLNRKFIKALLLMLAGLSILTLLSRLVNFYVVYPYLYQEYPEFELISVKRFLYSILDLVSIIALFASIKFLFEKLQAKKREERLEKEKLQSELQFLKAQINPHFLFNTLNNLYGLARRKSDDTETAIMKLSRIMRFMLYECDKMQIRLSQEIEAVNDYIALEKLRYGEELKISFKTINHAQDPFVAPLLLLPFVENAFKHGASESRHTRNISIEVRLEKNELVYRIENSTEGMALENPQGIGLKNAQRQLELIYPDRHQFSIKKTDKTFLVELRMELEQAFDQNTTAV